VSPIQRRKVANISAALFSVGVAVVLPLALTAGVLQLLNVDPLVIGLVLALAFIMMVVIIVLVIRVGRESLKNIGP